MWIIFFLLIASTCAVQVQRNDGVSSSATTVPINNDENLGSLRKKLIETGFIGEQSSTHEWRILIPSGLLQLNLENIIKVGDFAEKNGEPIIFTNILNKVDYLKVKIGDNISKTITLDKTAKLKAVREHLDAKGYLGSTTEWCSKWKFRLSGAELVNDESALTVAQYFENSGKDQIELINLYAQGRVVELWVYRGLDKLSLPRIPLSMNLYDFRMLLSGNGTCHGQRYNYLSNEWVTLKKTADLSDTAAGSPQFQISPDLVFTQPEEHSTVVSDAYFVSDNGKDSIEYVSKKRKGNLIGQVVYSYVKEVPTKVSMRVYKNTYCKGECNVGVTLDPVMLDYVQSTNTEIWSTSKVVVCEKGTAIGFDIDTNPRTPFWIKVKHGINDEVIVNSRSDHGKQQYWNYGYNNIVVDSHVIEKEEDLLKPKYMPTYLVQIYTLINSNPSSRRRRDKQVTLPDGSHDDGKLKPEGSAHTGPGSDAGFSAGNLITEFQFTLLTFKNSEIAQEIMGRAVNRRKRKDM